MGEELQGSAVQIGESVARKTNSCAQYKSGQYYRLAERKPAANGQNMKHVMGISACLTGTVS